MPPTSAGPRKGSVTRKKATMLSAPRSRAASTRLGGIERSRVSTITTTKGTACTVWPRMIASVPVGMSMVLTKMRSEMAEIMPGTTAGRQASAKSTARPQTPSARRSGARSRRR